MTHHNLIERLEAALHTGLPGVRITLDRPDQHTGMFWLDASYEGNSACVQWKPENQWGVSTGKHPSGYGEGPERTFTSYIQALSRTLEILKYGR